MGRNRSRGRLWGGALRVALGIAAVVALAADGCARKPAPEPWIGPPPELWFYEIANLQDKEIVDTITPLWVRAVKAGYTRVILADHKFARLGEMGYSYFDHAHRLRELADSLGLDIIPGVFQVGRSSAMLSDDPNLVEAIPVVDAPLEVRGGVAQIVPDPRVRFADKPTGKDPEVRISNGTATIHRNFWHARWWYDVPVSPHRCYRISVKIRTHSFKGKPLIQVLGGKRVIHHIKSLGVDRDQDWTDHEIVFNSLDYSTVRVYLGVWRRTRGSLEWRDWRIEEVGPVNLVRRNDAPFVLHEEGGAPLVEGRDYAPVVDTLMGNAPWAGQFEEWHEPPAIRVSRPDGTRLRASWQHAAIVYEKQVSCCLSEPETFARLEDEAKRVRDLWGPGRYMMMFDEIRALGQDSACVRTGKSSGQILADAVKRCAGYLPGDTLYVWNDMFDPYHNAVPDFFLVRGDLAGAWDGLAPSVGVVNWNGDHAHESLRFFADRKHPQVIAGYYDGAPESVRAWMEAAGGVPNIGAVMYTTWEDRYDDLEAFAAAVRRPVN